MAEEKEQLTSEQKPEEESHVKESLTASSEGRLLLAGVALSFIFTFWLGIKLLLSPEESQVLIGMTATEIMFGRAAGMAFGYSLGLGHSTVIPICMIIETLLVLIFYPLFVFSWRHLLVIKWLKNTLLANSIPCTSSKSKALDPFQIKQSAQYLADRWTWNPQIV